MTYLARLAARATRVRTALCVGIDPDPGALPPGWPTGIRGIALMAESLIEAAIPYAVAIKLNVAFFEAWGSDGLAVVERVRTRIPSELPLIIDAKRGDIGSTSERHAAALFDRLGADAVTASPYLGSEAIAPLLEREERFVYVLCRTSNPGAGELQDLLVSDPADATDGSAPMPLYLHVARRAATWNERFGTVGLVVGATAARELALVRDAAPSLPFLVPGLGRQGGDEAATLASGPARDGSAAAPPGGSLLVNVSRGITDTVRDATDPPAALASAVEGWAARLRV